jgi:RHS repeat-associated protein
VQDFQLLPNFLSLENGRRTKIWQPLDLSPDGPYRYGYQGQYAECDPETGGLDNFEARMYDPLLGRWNNTDPAGQFASPYLGMGNNPVNGTDPNGEVFGLDDIVAAIVGAVANVVANWGAITSGGSFWKDLARAGEYAGVGALAGVAFDQGDFAALAIASQWNVAIDGINGQLTDEGGDKSIFQSWATGFTSGLSGGEAGLDVANVLKKAKSLSEIGVKASEAGDDLKGFAKFMDSDKGITQYLYRPAYQGAKNVLQGYGSGSYNDDWSGAAGDFAGGYASSVFSDVTEVKKANRFHPKVGLQLAHAYGAAAINTGVTNGINTAISTGSISKAGSSFVSGLNPFYTSKDGIYENAIDISTDFGVGMVKARVTPYPRRVYDRHWGY